ncbi:MAG: SAM-dependent methyltransferase [Candidatus Paracaedibacteraceae bacterium]|nr:SAM-dependent methyltransferase [Candidatus Paracaedibacteraceae bacterium]
MNQKLHNNFIADRPVLLEDFISQVLYDPRYGYYANNNVIGKTQDFITAPHLSPLFSQCLAQWCVDQWVNAGRPTPLNLIELGAGQGIMLRDILTALQTAPELSAHLQAHILEKSENLKSIQKVTLQAHKQVEWIDNLNSIQRGYAIILANEFFDALPIQYYRYTNNEAEEAMVTPDQAISWRKTDVSIPSTPSQSIFMRSKYYEFFVKQISELFNRVGGVGLIIDYGGDHPGFTLQAIKNHKKVSFFDHLGEADLTHHVDFSYLKSLFRAHKINVLGPQKQSDFLLDLGIADMLEYVKQRVASDKFANHVLVVHRLTSSAEMGELFKVIAIQGVPHGC